MDGIHPFAPSLDTLGFLVREVADAAVLLAALAPAAAPRLAAPPARPPRLGLCRTEQWPLAEPATRRIVEDGAARLAREGADVAELDLGPEFTGLAAAQRTIMAAEAARTFGPIVAAHGDAVSLVLRELVRDGEAMTADAVAAARRQAERCRALLAGVFSRVDALLTPSAVGEAPPGLESTGDPAFNRIWTLLGTPCLSLPAARGPAGMPVGFQLVGRPGGDAALLAAGEWAEGTLPA
jgi:amidase